MKRLLLSGAVVSLYLVANPAFAVTFTNTNLYTTPHPKPVAITKNVASTNEFALEGGKSLRVYRNTIEGIRIWRFELDRAVWWVTDKGVIRGVDSPRKGRYAVDDDDAYRVYLSL